MINAFFDFKKSTYNADYGLSPEDYLKHFHVTDVYTLTVPSSDKPLAIVLSCEQCGVVYIENLTYNPIYAKYSAGSVLYDYYLVRLIEKGKRMLYLSGGPFSYKKWYASVEEKVYVCLVFRNIIEYILYRGGLLLSAIKNKVKHS